MWMEVKAQKSFLGLPLSISQAFSCIPSWPRIPVFIRSHPEHGWMPVCPAPPRRAHAPYSGSRTNSDGSLGRLIPQGLLALTRNWYWQPGDRSSMTRYVSKVEATDCCQTCEPVGQRERRGNTCCVSSGLRLSLPSLGSTLGG